MESGKPEFCNDQSYQLQVVRKRRRDYVSVVCSPTERSSSAQGVATPMRVSMSHEVEVTLIGYFKSIGSF